MDGADTSACAGKREKWLKRNKVRQESEYAEPFSNFTPSRDERNQAKHESAEQNISFRRRKGETN